MERHEQSCAVIIGGTQGLGYAIAKRLLAEGCSKMVIAGATGIAAKMLSKALPPMQVLMLPLLQPILPTRMSVRP